MMKNHNKSLLALALTSLLCLTACGDGEDGKDGAPVNLAYQANPDSQEPPQVQVLPPFSVPAMSVSR